MKDSPDPPPAPDPNATAQAQTGSNIATALANARLNRMNQQTPWGSISYTQGPVDANGVPTYSADIQLSPEQQAILDAQQQQIMQRQGLAQRVLDQSGVDMTRPLDFSKVHPMLDRGQPYAGAAAANAPRSAPMPGKPQIAPRSQQSAQPSPEQMQAALAAHLSANPGALQQVIQLLAPYLQGEGK